MCRDYLSVAVNEGMEKNMEPAIIAFLELLYGSIPSFLANQREVFELRLGGPGFCTSCLRNMRASPNWDPCGGPNKRDYGSSGSILESPILGNSHMAYVENSQCQSFAGLL